MGKPRERGGRAYTGGRGGPVVAVKPRAPRRVSLAQHLWHLILIPLHDIVTFYKATFMRLSLFIHPSTSTSILGPGMKKTSTNKI